MTTPPPRREPRDRGGIPDGALVGFLAVLLGSVTLVWLATGLAAVLQHGRWPDITFTHSAPALRRLVTEPSDVDAAWRHPDPVQGLPSTAVFWTTLGILLALLLAVVLLGMIGWTRFRAPVKAQRAARERAAQAAAATPPPAAAAPAAVPAPEPVHAPATAPQPPPPAAPAPPVPPPSATPPAAPPADVPHPLSEAALVPRARDIRPEIPVIGRSLHDPLAYAIPLGRDTATATDLYGGLDRTFRVLAPPGARATARLLHAAVSGAPGPVLLTCTGPAAVEATRAAREKLGPLLVFDPLQLTGATQRLRWSPVQGCENPATADNRARALLEPVRPLARTLPADRHTQQTAHTLLRCWLHAAALDHRPVRQVHRWANGQASRDPVKILRTAKDAAADWAGTLESLLTGHEQQLDDARALTARALECLTQLHVLNSCSPSGSDAFRMESFLRERGTIYLVGEAMEARSSRELRLHPGAMPLLTALVEDVVEHGRRMAARSSSGRLDPPLLLALDDVATLAPVPVLPDLMSVGGRTGLPTIAVLRSDEQARHRWGDRGATVIEQSAALHIAIDSTTTETATVRLEDQAAFRTSL
ncbi:hypothetical protein GCM10027168_65700 [Streptomyces capparidis]